MNRSAKTGLGVGEPPNSTGFVSCLQSLANAEPREPLPVESWNTLADGIPRRSQSAFTYSAIWSSGGILSSAGVLLGYILTGIDLGFPRDMTSLPLMSF